MIITIIREKVFWVASRDDSPSEKGVAPTLTEALALIGLKPQPDPEELQEKYDEGYFDGLVDAEARTVTRPSPEQAAVGAMPATGDGGQDSMR